MLESNDDIGDLVERSRRGDKDALNRLCELYRDRLHNAARKKIDKSPELRDITSSEDITQSVLIKAVKNIDKFKYKGEVAVWGFFMKILERVIIDKKRMQNAQKRPQIDDRQPISGVLRQAAYKSSKGNTPSRILINREELSLVSRGLASLTENQRRAIELFLAGRTKQEIAREMKRKVDAIRMLIKRGYQKLAHIFPNLEDHP